VNFSYEVIMQTLHFLGWWHFCFKAICGTVEAN